MPHRRAFAIAAATFVALAMPAAASAADRVGVIDFNSVSAPVSPTGEGLVLSSVSSGNGISGDAFTGSVSVFGDSMDPAITSNAAVVFDATCTVDGANGVCSGADQDLLKPELGNVLIVAENLRDNNANGRIDSPDDADLNGQSLSFDFSALEGAPVTVDSIDVLDVEDVESGGHVDAYAGATLIKSVAIPSAGDNLLQTIQVGATGVTRLVVVLAGSAAVDNIRFRVAETPPPPPPPGGGEGCTPGFWKAPQHFDSWTGYAPTDNYNAVFGVSDTASLTLLGALEREGEGNSRGALGRHAVAALLNAASAGVDFDLTTAEVIAAVQAAYASKQYEATKNMFEDLNEQGCPLS